jgi:uncharacterized protein
MVKCRRRASLEFDWDRTNRRHLARHGVTAKEFEEALSNDPQYLDVDSEFGEERWSAIGHTNGLRMLYVVLTYRGKRVRPITAWDAPKWLQEIYFENR